MYWALISISLYMGAWWALQEGSWGGWWNWDPSEVFGLLILTKLLLMFHLQTSKQNFLLNTITTYSTSSLIITIYLILQMSYTLVSHNFGLSLVGYGYVNIFFTISLLVNIYFYFYINVKYSKSYIYLLNIFNHSHSNQKTKQLKTYTIINYLVIILIMYLYSLSFNPIINNIFWTSVSIEILNKWFSWLNIKLVLMLTVILLTIAFNSLSISTNFFYLLTSLTYYSPILLYNSSKPTLTLLTHNTLIILFIGSILNATTLHTYWCYYYESSSTWYGSYTQTFNKLNYFFENITMTVPLITTHSNIHSPNTSFWFSSNLETQFFLLDLTDNVLRQTIYSHVFMYSFGVTIFDVSTNLVELISTITVCWIYINFSRKIKIIF
jgi:cytochrome c biogenesis factor